MAFSSLITQKLLWERRRRTPGHIDQTPRQVRGDSPEAGTSGASEAAPSL